MSTNSNPFNNISNFIPKQKTAVTYQHLSFIGFCHLLYHIFHWFFDYVLYVYVVYNWGMLIGGGMMMLLSFLLCASTLAVYESLQIDFMGVGLLNEWHTKKPKTLSGRLFRHVNKNKVAVYIFLSLFTDPFIITAYFRKGQFNGLTARDWRFFLLSTLIGNLYWICVTALLGNGTASLWQWVIMHADFGNGWLFEHTIVIFDSLQPLWTQAFIYINHLIFAVKNYFI